MSLLRKVGLAGLIVACCPWSASQAGTYIGIGFGGPGYMVGPTAMGTVMAGATVGIIAPMGSAFGRRRLWSVRRRSLCSNRLSCNSQWLCNQPIRRHRRRRLAAPAPLPMPAPSTTADASSTPEVLPASAVGNGRIDFSTALQQLRFGDEQARASAAVSLGRMAPNRRSVPSSKPSTAIAVRKCEMLPLAAWV